MPGRSTFLRFKREIHLRFITKTIILTVFVQKIILELAEF